MRFILFISILLLFILSIPAVSAEETYLFSSKWGGDGAGFQGSGTADGQFWYPRQVGMDSNGNLYVADWYNNRIQKFGATGVFIKAWGALGAGNGQLNGPKGVALDTSDNVYVVDSGNGRVQKFDSNGNFLAKWGHTGSIDGCFSDPVGIAIDGHGNVYVADSWNNRVQKFDNTGTFLTKWGSAGTNNGLFNYPYGVAVDSSGYVYVADTVNHRIQKFDATGSFITTWGSLGTNPGQFHSPDGIAVDSAGDIYVADTLNSRIQKFTANGNLVTMWGGSGAGDGQFVAPRGIIVRGTGTVYVTDYERNMVQVFVKSVGTLTTTPTTTTPITTTPITTTPITTTPTTTTTTLIPNAASGFETPLIIHDADQIDPAIHGSRVIWQDWRNNDWYEGKIIAESQGDIYSHNLTSHIEQPEGASTSTYGKWRPNDRDSVISDTGIFWVFAGRSDADTNNEIHGRTLGGEPIDVTSVGDPGERYIQDLALDGHRLTYVVNDIDSHYRLILYDTNTRYVFTIHESDNEIRSPAISGDNIVWQEYNGYSWVMYRYNLMEGTSREFAYGVGDRASLAIDGNRIIWSGERGGDYNLYLWDLTESYPSGEPWLIAAGDQMNPAISGDRVVWQDNRTGNWDIYMGSLSSGVVTSVCSAYGDQEMPDVDGNHIVWQDKRNWNNWDIYMFTVSSTGPSPVPTPAALIITSPGTYSIAADGFDGTTTPIEIRSSNVVLDGMGHTIDGSNQPGTCGIRIAGGGALLSNVVVKNVRLTNWEMGIYADGVADSAIEASEIAHNYQGIVLEDAQHVQVKENKVTANDVTGIKVMDSGNTLVRANDVVKIGDGFTNYGGGGGSLDQEYAYAVRVAGSSGTEISHNNISDDVICLFLLNSFSTRVTGNQLGGRCGIFSYSSGGGTAVFDNIFSSGYVYGNFPDAVWNTTPSPGPNVVGGPKIGGNFWASSDGTGFSETHSDTNGDGFCDEPFDAIYYGDAIDFYPLARWSGPVIVNVPGAAGLPADINSDGLYEDVNGNGRKDFADVVLYFNQMSWIAANEPLTALDYNGNGRIDFADVVWLFTHL